MWIVSGQAGIQIRLLDLKIYAIVHFRVCSCCPMTALQAQEDSSHISVTLLCKLNVLSTFRCTSVGSLSTWITLPQFADVPLQVCHLGQITELPVWCDKHSKAPSMQALNLGQTLEVDRSKSLSCRHLPTKAFPVGPVPFAFEEDVTYIFPHKLRAFLWPGHSKQEVGFGLLSVPELEWTSEELLMGRMLIT